MEAPKLTGGRHGPLTIMICAVPKVGPSRPNRIERADRYRWMEGKSPEFIPGSRVKLSILRADSARFKPQSAPIPQRFPSAVGIPLERAGKSPG